MITFRKKKKDDIFHSKDIEITEEFQEALNIMEYSNDPLYITGKAGTGKSTLLKHFRDNTKKNVVFVAPTGVAAIHINGVTIHSFFQLPFGMLTDEDIEMHYHKRDIYEKLETLVIDEVSMVRADVMRAIDKMLRKNKKSKRPFGGVQIIMFGDLYQLPPVVVDREEKQYLKDVFGGIYFFHGLSFKKTGLTKIVLEKNFRQKNDQKFLDILNRVRENKLHVEDIKKLNKQVLKNNEKPETAIVLATTNRIADSINTEELKKLKGKEYTFPAVVKGSFDTKKAPGDMKLKLKVGAQIMMIKNDIESPRRWANGTLGTVENIKGSIIYVNIDGKKHMVDMAVWEEAEYVFDRDAEEVLRSTKGSFVQYPIKLAWAVTIHKSQGKTFERVIVDLGSRTFAHGQAYVALSRCTNLASLYLKRPIRQSDIIVDNQVREFHQK
jgi:ATP-dependent DNA helicase PIF1